MNFKTNFNPTEYHLEQINDWLLQEFEINNEGFYNNWENIFNAFHNSTLIVLTENNLAVGFIVYSIHNFTVEIDIAVLKSNYKRQGYGGVFINESLDKFKNDGILVCQLFCAPESSRPIWEKLGFSNFPTSLNKHSIRMFKPLVSTSGFSKLNEAKKQIELWNCEPFKAKSIKPKWIWDLNLKANSTELENFIIFPIHYDWQMRYSLENKIIYEGKIKYFDIFKILFNSFMIVRSLSNPK